MSLIAPAPKTPLTPGQALGVLEAALPSGFTRTGVLMVAAQSAVETAHWGAMYGWNFGNVTPSANQLAQGANYFEHPETGSMRYLAFKNPLDGARAMTAWLQSHGVYQAAELGDLAGYMQALQNGSYLGTVGLVDGSGHTVSQDDYTAYGADIASIANELANVAAVPYSPSSGWWKAAGLAALAGLGLWQRGAVMGAARHALAWLKG